MIVYPTQREVEDWNQSLHTYQKQKRTRRPFGKAHPKVQFKTVNEVIEKEMRFNPVLQSFRSEREESKTIEQEQIQKMNQQIKYLKNNYKYNTDYDIINLNQSIALPPSYRSQSLHPQDRKKQYRDPIYQNYNIINGKQYEPQYLKKIGFKQVKKYDRNIHPSESRVYNIINGKYSDNAEESAVMEDSRNNQQTIDRAHQLRVYDTINSRYYNPQVEQQYQHRQKQQEMSQSQRHHLPPSYINRQPYIQGRSKELPEVVKRIDEQQAQSKERYKMRYIVDNEYRMRNIEDTEKKDRQIRNRVHNGRVLEEKGKEFNIINCQRYQNSRAEELFGKEITGSPYDLKPSIKQNGFSLGSISCRE